MRRRFLWERRFLAVLGVVAAAATIARAEVVSLTVGVDSTCPYGVVG